MVATTAKMETLMEQLCTSGGGQVPGASTTANSQPEHAYEPTTFTPLPQASNPVGITAPLREI